MGAWSAAIKGNDVTDGLYYRFMEKYDSGVDPRQVTKEILEEFKEDFESYEDRHNALFGLALAQWQTACLDSDLHNEIKDIITSGKDLALWKELDADPATLRERKKALDRFLRRLAIVKDKPRRRQKKAKFDFKQVELVRVVAPDDKKDFSIAEAYVNGEYQSTQGLMGWDIGGSGILAFRKQSSRITAHWKDSSTLVVTHDKDIEFWQKEDKFFFCGDQGIIEYIPIDQP